MTRPLPLVALALLAAIASSAAVATVAYASLAYTDTGRYTPQGTYQCYQVETTYNTWYSVSGNPTPAQLGFVASSVAVTNGGVAGKLDTGDTIVVTYNQAVNTATGPAATDNVRTDTGTNTIVVGSTPPVPPAPRPSAPSPA